MPQESHKEDLTVTQTELPPESQVVDPLVSQAEVEHHESQFEKHESKVEHNGTEFDEPDSQDEQIDQGSDEAQAELERGYERSDDDVLVDGNAVDVDLSGIQDKEKGHLSEEEEIEDIDYEKEMGQDDESSEEEDIKKPLLPRFS